jgi:hypothetical protein
MAKDEFILSELGICYFLPFSLFAKAGHVERYQLQSYRFKPFFVTF